LAGRTPHEALDSYLTPLRQAVSCLTRAYLNHSGTAPERTHALVLESNLRGEDARWSMSVGQTYALVETDDPERGPWKVSTRAYSYTLDDAEGREVLAYQWHPDGPSPMKRPHMHFGAGAGIEQAPISGIHFPTNRVSIEDFLWLLLEEFDIQPSRADWRSVLHQTREAFEAWQTWPSPRAGPEGA
jgi:hypothetical protein